MWPETPSTEVIQLTLTLKMTTAQVVETSVTVHNSPRLPARSYSTNLSLQLIKRNKQINKKTNQSGLFTRVGKYCVREFMWSHVSLVVRCFGRTKTVKKRKKEQQRYNYWINVEIINICDIRILLPALAIGKTYPVRNSEIKIINRNELYAFEEIAIMHQSIPPAPRPPPPGLTPGN